MSKMYEALQNPYFKKIWEKINWQIRHPEAENLNLALGSEYLQYPKECITLASQDGVIKENLGRPITLEDILILFNGKFTHLRMKDGYYIFENTTYNYPNDNEYTGTIIRSTTIFKLKIRTEFEDQTPETWETMANLIN